LSNQKPIFLPFSLDGDPLSRPTTGDGAGPGAIQDPLVWALGLRFLYLLFLTRDHLEIADISPHLSAISFRSLRVSFHFSFERRLSGCNGSRSESPLSPLLSSTGGPLLLKDSQSRSPPELTDDLGFICLPCFPPLLTRSPPSVTRSFFFGTPVMPLSLVSSTRPMC